MGYKWMVLVLVLAFLEAWRQGRSELSAAFDDKRGPQNTHQRDLMREAKVDMQGVLEESYGGEPQAKRHRGLQLSSLNIIHTSAADALPEAQGSCASDSAAPAALDPSDEWDETWERHLQLLEAFKADNGHPHAHNSDFGVGPWVKEQRQLFKDGKLSPAQEQRLRNIGFVFDRMAAAQMRTALELRNWGYYEEEEEEEEGGLFKADAVNEEEEEEVRLVSSLCAYLTVLA
eukprot:Tamp_24932.p1 GENE.Tamp_24932~~Tamp_24932.p1  ORF type:complete len:260 (+),score=48.08 Tamp_24932:89-781(+)